jgi:taurine dioxygenase
MLETRPLAPFGIEMLRDLSAPLSPAESEELVALLWEHSLVVARGQRLTMDRQRELCGLAGPILLREGETGIMDNSSGEASMVELSWHSDAAYTRAPFDALSLHALDVVADASSTRFVSAEQGWASLPDHLKSALADARLEMISPGFDALGGRTCDTREPTALKRGETPAVYRNPHNGRDCLWTSELQTARVLGMAWEASRDLLHAVFDHLYRPDHILEHHWRTGDLLIWDNVALQHMRGSLKACGRRVLQRVIVGTEGVAPHIEQAA